MLTEHFGPAGLKPGMTGSGAWAICEARGDRVGPQEKVLSVFPLGRASWRQKQVGDALTDDWSALSASDYANVRATVVDF
jgi:hypothetical protein